MKEGAFVTIGFSNNKLKMSIGRASSFLVVFLAIVATAIAVQNVKKRNFSKL